MSSITAAGSTTFGFEALNVAMTKRANDQQGQAALQLLQGAIQSTAQVQQAVPATKLAPQQRREHDAHLQRQLLQRHFGHGDRHDHPGQLHRSCSGGAGRHPADLCGAQLHWQQRLLAAD